MRDTSFRALGRFAVACACVISLISAGPVRASSKPVARATSTRKAHPSGAAYKDGEILVRFKPGKQPKDASAVGAGSMSASGIPGWSLVRLKSGESVSHAQGRLRRDARVADVTPNHVYKSLSVPNDSLFSWQWGLQNTGQPVPGDGGIFTGVPGADISATRAWAVTTGSSTVKVAIADSGVAYDHPDLAPNMDLGDGAGCTDTPPACSNSKPFYDDFGHGTHVAGIIGAAANDGFGVSGVSQHVSLVPVKVLDSTGSGYTSTIGAGFAWAAAHGAKIVNASLGGAESDPALLAAIQGAPNTLFVVAAGNAGRNNDVAGQATYPCNYTAANLICVAASDENDDLASFSDYGRTSVDLAAPGTDIWSTYPPSVAGRSGTHALEDSPSGGYADSSDTWAATTSPIDLTSHSGCDLHYAIRGFLADNHDVLTIETSTDGTTWNMVPGSSFSYNDSSAGWGSLHDLALGADHQSIKIRFHLVGDSSGTDDGVYIDDVSVVCTGPQSATIFSDNFESGMGNWTVSTGSQWGIGSKFWQWIPDTGTSMATPMVAGTAALIWAHQPAATVAHVKNVILGSVDVKTAFAGKTVTGGRLNAARALQYSDDNTAPTGLVFGGMVTKPFQLGPSMTFSWGATDAGTGASGVLSYDVRYESAHFNGGWGPWVTWKSGTTARSATFSSSPGYSYCFEVRARDRALNVSGWKVACTSFPVNDTQMTASAGWTRAKSSSRYLGTDSYTRTKGATLTLAKVYFRTLDLVVTLCNGCGSVAVYFGSGLYGTYSLNTSSLQTRHLILVRAWSHVVGPATVTIKVTTSGKPVAIEGLGVLRY